LEIWLGSIQNVIAMVHVQTWYVMLFVALIFSVQVSAELPVDLDEADEEQKIGSPLVLYVFGRGCVHLYPKPLTN
jgi:hypothetical protein